MKNSLFYILLSILFLSFSCTKKDPNRLNPEQLVQAEITKKMQSYETTEIAKCNQNLLERAAEIADSTLLARAKAERTNPLERPLKPLKPLRPEALMAQDTTPVAPLIDSIQ